MDRSSALVVARRPVVAARDSPVVAGVAGSGSTRAPPGSFERVVTPVWRQRVAVAVVPSMAPQRMAVVVGEAAEEAGAEEVAAVARSPVA